MPGVDIPYIHSMCIYIYMIIYAPKHEFLEVFLPRQMAPQARWVAVATRLIGWFNMTSPTRLQNHPSNITSSGKRMQIDKWGRCVLPLSFDSNPSECIACIPTQDSAVKLCQFTLSSLALCTWNFIPVRNWYPDNTGITSCNPSRGISNQVRSLRIWPPFRSVGHAIGFSEA
jgi:hypothetical protein